MVLLIWAVGVRLEAGVTFFVNPDGLLYSANPARDAGFRAAATLSVTEFDFPQQGAGYIQEPSPLMAGPVRVRPNLLNAAGNNAADLLANGNRLIETYPAVPNIPGIIDGTPSAALLNRTYAGNARDVVGAAIEFTFSEPVEAFGTWILDDIVEASRYVLRVTETGGMTHTSSAMDGGNGVQLAVEGFIGAVSTVGITRVVVEQQTLAGAPSNTDFFYLDHVQVGGRLPPEICDNGTDDNADGQADCRDSECEPHPHCRENCTDAIDNDGNGLVDCDDPDCKNNAAHPQCGETLCSDGADNDGDGKADCADVDCFGPAACATEQLCGDGQDNDRDTRTDCADPDCTEDAACPEDCSDGTDNDADGRVDCADLECMELPQCPTPCDGFATPAASGACVDPTCHCTLGCSNGPRFFIAADGRLAEADSRRDLDFRAAVGEPLTEFDFNGFGAGYLVEPPELWAGAIRVRPIVLDAAGNVAIAPETNGGRLIETYPVVPYLPGIIAGQQTGGAALLNRTVSPNGDTVVGAGVAFSFSQPVKAFGVWVIEDHLQADRYVLRLEQVDGRTFTSGPLESDNGATLAVEGFIGAISEVGISRVVIEQQALSVGGVGVVSHGDLFYLDHVQVGGSPCHDPFADMDGDRDVDQSDFGRWQLCVSGKGLAADRTCHCLDRDRDGDVDSDDLQAFLQCLNGPDKPADPACDN